MSRDAVAPAAPPPLPDSARLPAKVGRRDLAAYEEAAAKRGFRIGFAVPVVAAGLALGLYLGAPWLSARLPVVEPLMRTLVAQGDMVQEQLAAQILAAFDRLGAGGGS